MDAVTEGMCGWRLGARCRPTTGAGSLSPAMRTRIAPTPSGFLHVGNLVNFQLTAWWAQNLGLDLSLRIDDIDAGRCRPDYVADIFRVLESLDIRWQSGPVSPADLERNFSQSKQVAYFRSALHDAVARGLAVYRCDCSRTEVTSTTDCACRREHSSVDHRAALRLDASCLPGADGKQFDGTVLWRRDDVPAYHLVSIVTDRDLGTTHILRGEDLAESSRLQQALAPFFDAPLLASATIEHHRLMTDDEGRKLSKSSGRQAQPLSLTRDLLSDVHAMALDLGAPLGIRDPRPAADSA